MTTLYILIGIVIGSIITYALVYKFKVKPMEMSFEIWQAFIQGVTDTGSVERTTLYTAKEE